MVWLVSAVSFRSFRFGGFVSLVSVVSVLSFRWFRSFRFARFARFGRFGPFRFVVSGFSTCLLNSQTPIKFHRRFDCIKTLISPPYKLVSLALIDKTRHHSYRAYALSRNKKLNRKPFSG